MGRLILSWALATAMAGMTPHVGSAWADSSGAVTGTLTAPGGACIKLDSTAVNFGAAPGFSTPSKATLVQGSPNTTVSNCATSTVHILARGSDATASTPSVVTWTLTGSATNPCAVGTNRYGYDLAGAVAGKKFDKPLMAADQQLLDIAGNGSQLMSHVVTMPCVGSSGGGQTFTMSVLFTATF